MYRKEKRKLSFYLLSLYVFLMFCIYPLYYDDGYYNIGTAKCKFFLSLSIMGFLSILSATVIEMIIEKKRNHMVNSWKKISITEKLIYVYGIIILLSFIFSEFKKNILWGATDWYIGTVPLLLMVFFALCLAHTWEHQHWLMMGFLIVSAIVFLLGICNRFSVYPIAIQPVNSGFISTLGNINWFCGYMSVVSPIGIGLYVFTSEENYKNRWQKWLLLVYTMIVFVMGFCQGSSGVFLWIGALFLTLFGVLPKSTYGIKKWLSLVAMWGVAGQLVRILRIVFWQQYNYDVSIFVDTNITLIIAIIAVCLHVVIDFGLRKGKDPIEKLSLGLRRKGNCFNLYMMIIICILLWLVVSIYNTKIGISFLKENSLFFLDENWGNGRGMIFKTSVEIFKEMSWMQKLFGVGPDGFSAFAYSIPTIQAGLYNYFGESILTNAHCEILTNLINLGIIGTAVYIGVFATFVARCLKRGKEHAYAYIPALCVICYFANNIISFAQVLSIPYLFLIMGCGEAMIKRRDEER